MCGVCDDGTGGEPPSPRAIAANALESVGGNVVAWNKGVDAEVKARRSERGDEYSLQAMKAYR